MKYILLCMTQTRLRLHARARVYTYIIEGFIEIDFPYNASRCRTALAWINLWSIRRSY